MSKLEVKNALSKNTQLSISEKLKMLNVYDKLDLKQKMRFINQKYDEQAKLQLEKSNSMAKAIRRRTSEMKLFAAQDASTEKRVKKPKRFTPETMQSSTLSQTLKRVVSVNERYGSSNKVIPMLPNVIDLLHPVISRRNSSLSQAKSFSSPEKAFVETKVNNSGMHKCRYFYLLDSLKTVTLSFVMLFDS